MTAPTTLPRPSSRSSFLTTGFAAVAPALLLAASASAEVNYQGLILTPALDRWMYPFGAQAGAEATISTFGSEPGAPDFDSRDGQMLVRFDTGSLVPAGLGAHRYLVTSLRLTVEFANDLIVEYDPTPDPWQSFLDPSDPEWVPDPDPGQPVELFGVGFRNGFSLQTFAENSPYTVPPNSPLSPSVRNAFALSFNEQGAAIDVSNNPREGFDPKRFSVGLIDGLEPGDLIPVGTVMHFDLDVSDPDIQGYLAKGVDAGRLMFAITSLTFVVQQGGNFPRFYSKENAFVIFGLAQPARLEYQVTILPECIPADLNCDGSVNGADLALLLGTWGPCVGCAADLNNDGVVNGADLAILLGKWTG
ncbi:MAG: dockerin type I repeat-containing protein [Phycisphaeraceae bacterium]|nr:dockerin type I repeat-containing protein [Phycisphaeraceae bacterium]